MNSSRLLQSSPITYDESGEDGSLAPRKEFKPSLFHQHAWILILIFGQLIAVLNAGTAVFSKLLAEQDISLPFCQSLLNYILLNIFFIPLMITRWRKYQQGQECLIPGPDGFPTIVPTPQNSSAGTDSTCPPSEHSLSQPPKSLFQLTRHELFAICFATRHAKLWFYLIISLLDVQGNFLIVKAYKYTTMLAVQLIDSANLPFVLVFSYILLSQSFSQRQLMACLCSLIGLIICIATDTYLDHHKNPSSASNPFNFLSVDASESNSRSILIGDGLVLAACVCYSLSNIVQEAVLTDSINTSRFELRSLLGMGRPEPLHLDNIDNSGLFDPSERRTIPHDHNSNNYTDFSPEILSAKNGSNDSSTDKISPISVNIDRTLEYLAFLGLCGICIGGFEGLIFEHKGLKKLILGGVFFQTTTLFYILGYTVSIFFMYICMPILVQNAGAVVLNLSLLMTDVYSAIASLLIFTYPISWLYIIAFAVIAFGLMLYNSNPAPKAASTRPRSDLNEA